MPQDDNKNNFIYKLKRVLNLVFPVAILLVLLASFFVALIGPVEINEYENRYAERMQMPTIETYINSEFQDSVELALADQVPFAIQAKKLYNAVFSKFNAYVYSFAKDFYDSSNVADEVSDDDELELQKKEQDRQQQLVEARGIRKDVEIDPNFMYISLSDGQQIYDDHIFTKTLSLDEEKAFLDKRINNTNDLISRYPDMDINIYYIEREVDVNFETGKRSGIYEYLCENIHLPEENKAAFMLNSFAELDKYFYKYDHHWNNVGSYLAYTKVLKWLLPDEEPIKPIATWEIGPYGGSKAKGILSGYSEMFMGYEFDYRYKVKFQINGQEASKYSSEANYIENVKNGAAQPGITYGIYYGQDVGEAVFTNAESTNGSILIIGDSYDNAILTLLAQHFSTIYSIDLRNYKAQMGKDFDIDSYLESHDIDRILLIGCSAFWDKSDFNIY